MKESCSLIGLIFLVTMTGLCASYNQNDVTGYLNFLRAEHGANKLRFDKGGLEYAAYEATNAVCNYGFGHHKGTESEFASLWASPYECQNDQEKSEIEALASWYTECPLYYGQGFDTRTGHFTHMVWKSAKKYGIWAQTCPNGIPGSNDKCVVALKTDDGNVIGSFSRNIGNVGRCFNIKAQSWFKHKDKFPRLYLSPISTYGLRPPGLMPFINNQHFLPSAFPFSYNLDSKLTQNVEKYTNEEFKPTEAPVVPEGYAAPQADGEDFSEIGCRNYKGEEVPCNLG